MTDKPKGQRMFAVVSDRGHIRSVSYFARCTRIEIGRMWADGRKSETWEDGVQNPIPTQLKGVT